MLNKEDVLKFINGEYEGYNDKLNDEDIHNIINEEFNSFQEEHMEDKSVVELGNHLEELPQSMDKLMGLYHKLSNEDTITTSDEALKKQFKNESDNILKEALFGNAEYVEEKHPYHYTPLTEEETLHRILKDIFINAASILAASDWDIFQDEYLID